MSGEVQISQDFILSSLGCAFQVSTGTLLLADLHIGYEVVLEGDGFAMPRYQTEEMLSRIDLAIDRYDPSIVVVDGDFKHNFDRNLSAEWRDVEKMVDRITSRSKLVVIRGNHDNYLATILARKGMHLRKEAVMGNVKILHGHETSTPWQGGMVFGHEHPALTLREKTGASVKVPCFLYDKEENRLVLPAFSPLATGSDIIRTPDEERMIPLLSQTGVDQYIAYGFFKDQILNYQSIGELRSIGKL